MLETLKQIIEEKQAKTYLKALELGSPTISRLSKKTGIPRSTTYLILDELEDKGLITRSSQNGKTKIIPASPQSLERIITKRVKDLNQNKLQLEALIPELQALHARNTKKPKVQYYEGEDNIRNLLFKMIEESKDSIYMNLCQGYSQKHAGLIDDPDYIKEAIKLVKEYNVTGKEILEDMTSARQYKESMKTTSIEILLAPQLNNSETAHIDKYIWADNVAFLNSENNYAVLIQDQFIAENERISFNVMWNALKNDCYTY